MSGRVHTQLYGSRPSKPPESTTRPWTLPVEERLMIDMDSPASLTWSFHRSRWMIRHCPRTHRAHGPHGHDDLPPKIWPFVSRCRLKCCRLYRSYSIQNMETGNIACSFPMRASKCAYTMVKPVTSAGTCSWSNGSSILWSS